MLGSAKHFAKQAEELAKKKRLAEAGKLKNSVRKTPGADAISSIKTDKTDPMWDDSSIATQNTAEVSTHGNSEPNDSQAKKRGSGLFGFGMKPRKEKTPASLPVPPRISTGQSTQELPKVSWRLAKMQKESEITLRILRDTIASQEMEVSRKGKEAQIALQQAKAGLAEGNKRAAIRHMKMVKRCNLEQDKTTAAIETMEQQVLTIESALNNLKCFEAMQAGKTALCTLQGNDGKAKGPSFSDQMEDLMDDLRDSNDIAQEINLMLSLDVTTTPIDEDELLRELERLAGCHRTAAAERSSSNLLPNLPEAPSTPLPGSAASTYDPITL